MVQHFPAPYPGISRRDHTHDMSEGRREKGKSKGDYADSSPVAAIHIEYKHSRLATSDSKTSTKRGRDGLFQLIWSKANEFPPLENRWEQAGARDMG